MEGIQTIEQTFDEARKKGVIPFKPEVTAKSYQIEITADDFGDLVSYENKQEEYDVLIDELDKSTCVYDVDYSPHFGNFIYLTLAAGDDRADEWADIERIITEQIEKAKQWKLDNPD